MTRKRVLYYDALRIFAAFFVILIHVTAEQYSTDHSALSWYINWGYNRFSRWAVPVFCMVTGALMLHRELKITTVYKKNILHIASLLLFWGLYYWLVPTRDFTVAALVNAVKSLFSGKAYSHLWYLYMLLGFYAVSPLLGKIVQNSSKRTVEYFLLVLLATTIVLPFLGVYFPFLNSLLSAFKFCFVGGDYLFYFLAGYYLSTYPWKKHIRMIYSLTGIGLLLCVAVGYCGVASMRSGGENGMPLIVVALGATSVFILFQLLDETLFSRKIMSACIRFMAPLTFGIYLIHFRVEKILLSAGLDFNMIHPLVGALLVSFVVFAISTILSWVLSKIPLVKKLIQ